MRHLIKQINDDLREDDLVAIDILLQILVFKKAEELNLEEKSHLSFMMTQTYALYEAVENATSIIEKKRPELAQLFDFHKKISDESLLIQMMFKIAQMQIDDWSTFIEELLDDSLTRGKEDIRTPKQINKLFIQLLNPEAGTLYDGTVGLAGTLIEARQYNQDLEVYGEDINEQAVRIARLRLLLETNQLVTIKKSDSLHHPAFSEGSKLKQFDYVAMHPPFAMKLTNLKAIEEDQYSRFFYGDVMQSRADYAYIMHGIASLKETGKAAFLVMASPLSRGGAEETIRRNLLTADLVEAVIALPGKMLSHTSIQSYILIINKEKAEAMQGKIQFINAANEYESMRGQNYLTEEQVEKVTKAYHEKKELSDFSTIITHDELLDFSLLPEKYVVEKEIESDILGNVRIKYDAMKQNNNFVALKDLVTDIYRGLNITASTVEEGRGPLKIIQLSDVEDGYLSLEHLASGTLIRKSNIDNYRVQAGDVIISNRGSHVKIAVVPEVEGQVILSHNFLGLRLKASVDPYYLKMYLESPLGQFEIAQQQVGANVLTISPKGMEKVKVLNQEEASRFGQMYEEANMSYKRQLEALEEKRQEAIKQTYEQAGLFQFIEKE